MTYTKSLVEVEMDFMSPAQPFYSQCFISLDFLFVLSSHRMSSLDTNTIFSISLSDSILLFQSGGQEEETMNCSDIIFLSYGKSLQCNEVFICGQTAWFLNY